MTSLPVLKKKKKKKKKKKHRDVRIKVGQIHERVVTKKVCLMFLWCYLDHVD
jgi:hypothetical protein